MIWRALRLPKGLQLSVLIALAVPALIGLTAITTLADSSPSPSGTPTPPLPGDPARGAMLYGQNCAGCHGGSLEGGVGPALNPIYKLPGVTDPLDANWLIDVITNGRKHQPGDPGTQDMKPKGGNDKLTDQDIKDLAAYIIQENRTGSPPLSAGELAKRTILWVSIGILAMIFITYLLSQYNMRWIARRAAARRK
jgi:mono/diheme cytochrome c family protein